LNVRANYIEQLQMAAAMAQIQREWDGGFLNPCKLLGGIPVINVRRDDRDLPQWQNAIKVG
jgi:hypothetical protein